MAKKPRRKSVKQKALPKIYKHPELEAFAGFCELLILDSGKRMVLEPFQRRIAKSILVDKIVETTVSIPKGNAKTTLLAAIALWHILITPEARCYIGAASAQQAGEMFKHAWGFVRRAAAKGEELAKLVNVQKGYKKIETADGEGFLEVRAADANTQDGVGPTLALVDEYHRHPNDNLYGVFRDGLDKRDGQLVTISTAGDDEDSPLGRLRANLRQHVVATDGRYIYCYDKEGGAVLHEWALTDDDDPNDLATVKLANPLSTITSQKLRRRRSSPSMTNGKWNRFTCNLWGQGDEAAITKIAWGAVHDPEAEIPEDVEIHLGVDLGWKWDTTAMVPVWWCEESQRWIIGQVTILVPPRDGSRMADGKVWAALRWYAERYRVTIVIDPNAGGIEFAPKIEENLGVEGDENGVTEVIEHAQAATPMAAASMLTVEMISTGAFAHGGDPEYTKQMLAAVAEPVMGDDELYRFDKPRTRRSARRKRGEEREFRCIDAAIATAMALRVAAAWETAGELEPFVI